MKTPTPTPTRLAFIGGGNMAGGIIGGLLESGWPVENLSVSDPDDERRRALRRRFGLTCLRDNAQCAQRGEVVVLAVKPQFLRAATASIAALLQREKPLLISIAAGIRCADVLRWAGGELALVRVMPNTPALVNAGISGLFANPLASEAQRELAQTVMQAVGETVWVQRESLINVVTAVSGSGPAYFFKLMELLAASAAEHGLDRETAEKLAMHTALGAAVLAGRDGQPPATLRQQVTSPGGTTQSALAEMESRGLHQAVQAGVAAAVRRAEQLADEFGAI